MENFSERLSDFFAVKPYALPQAEKTALFDQMMQDLTLFHAEHCPPYRAILDGMGIWPAVPALPVRLFKEMTLKSVPDAQVDRTLTSSGTSSMVPSRIYLDTQTAGLQQKALAAIAASVIGDERLPMIIIDTASVLKDRRAFSARGAGIMGFSMFGRDRFFALDAQMQLDFAGLQAFLDKHRGERILLFGFTYMIWQYFYEALLRLKEEGFTADLSKGILIHGGGWKKLADRSVSPDVYKESLRSVCGLSEVYDYYGMAEQTGSIYMQCACGHYHASLFSEVRIINPTDFSECPVGVPGLIRTESVLAGSYPGHALLTEDMGMLLGEDDCPCGRKGRYFSILGRARKAQLRGCADTFEQTADISPSGPDRGPVTSDTVPAPHSEATALPADLPEKIRFEVGTPELLAAPAPPAPAFEAGRMDFLQTVSRILMEDPEARAYPEVITFAFWIRKSHMMEAGANFAETLSSAPGKSGPAVRHTGKGTIFHIAPSNVPVNYAYSFVTAFICGNRCIVRIPGEEAPQISLISRAFEKGLESFPMYRPYVFFVRYERDQAVNDCFSAMCDVRVVWGGDDTIRALRTSALPPRASEVTFADRFSLAVIDAADYLGRTASDPDAAGRIAADFYNDTMLLDQNACTSPHLIAWLGDGISVEKAKHIFWDAAHAQAAGRDPVSEIRAVDKLTAFCLAASAVPEAFALEKQEDYRMMRVRVQGALTEQIIRTIYDQRGHSGYFYEMETEDIRDLAPLCGEKVQTVSLIGPASCLDPLFEAGIRGIDRVVPFGHTMDFDFFWDGYDLKRCFTRSTSILCP